MRSPFPGMDPYLEDPTRWSDFHATFVLTWSEAIGDVLPKPYDVNIAVRYTTPDPEPDLIYLDPLRESYLEIRTHPARELVTVLELRGSDRERVRAMRGRSNVGND